MALILQPIFAEDGIISEGEIDNSNQLIARKWGQLNRSVDMFFSNQSATNRQSNSHIKAYSNFYKKEGQLIASEYNFEIRIDLPNTAKRLKIVIEKQQNDIADALSDYSLRNKSSLKSSKVKNSQVEKSYTAGAIFLNQYQYFASLVKLGIRLDMPLNPFAKLELSKNINTKYMAIEFMQKFLYYRQAGLQEISQIIFNKNFNENFQLDFINSIVWSEETDYFNVRNSFILYHNLGDTKGLSYSIGANSRLNPYRYESFDTSVSYRQALYKDWLYATWSIGADFPKINNYKNEKIIQFKIDIYFKEKS